jgi:hypothetical protein
MAGLAGVGPRRGHGGAGPAAVAPVAPLLAKALLPSLHVEEDGDAVADEGGDRRLRAAEAGFGRRWPASGGGGQRPAVVAGVRRRWPVSGGGAREISCERERGLLGEK